MKISYSISLKGITTTTNYRDGWNVQWLNEL